MASDGHDPTWIQWALQFGWGVLVIWFARIEKVLSTRSDVIADHTTRMGAHGVRLANLEARAAEDRQSIRDGFTEIKTYLSRIEDKMEGKADK